MLQINWNEDKQTQSFSAQLDGVFGAPRARSNPDMRRSTSGNEDLRRIEAWLRGARAHVESDGTRAVGAIVDAFGVQHRWVYYRRTERLEVGGVTVKDRVGANGLFNRILRLPRIA